MKIILYTPVLASLLLTACGGDGGASLNSLPVNRAPTITDPGAINHPENGAVVTTLTMSDPENNDLVVTLGGDDASAFSLSDTYELRFTTAPDFEAPADTGTDNVYNITVSAADSFSSPTTLSLAITVTDVEPEGFPEVSVNVTTDAETFLSENIITSFEFPSAIIADTDKYQVTGVFADLGFATVGWHAFQSDVDAARIGEASVTTCELGGNCDAPTGSILVQDIQVTKDAIGFLMSGGDGSNLVGVEVRLAADDSVLATYHPNSCGDSRVKGDEHYVYFDTSQIVGTLVDLYIYDNNPGGCGFVSFDHFYHTNSPFGSVAAVVNAVLDPVNVQSEAAAISGLIPFASFENPVDMLASRGWSATGDFANPASINAWQGTTRDSAAARLGGLAVSTCELNENAAGCDAPTGTVTSPEFKVTDDFVNFLMGGGNGTAPVGVNITDTVGNVLHTFSPNSCGPSFIDGDNDWTAIDVSALKDAFVKLNIFDNETGGCGFVSFDHFYQAAAAYNPGANGVDGGRVTLAEGQIANLGFNVTFAEDAFDQVIGDFDDATLNDWTATGDFMNPAAADSWQNPAGAARVGGRYVTTCELNANASGCDMPRGSLTSPMFMVYAARPYLNLLLAGGNGSAPVGMRVLDAGATEIASSTPNSCGPPWIDGDDDWVTVDLTAQIGTMVQVEIFDNEPGGCGFVSFDHVHMSGTALAD